MDGLFLLISAVYMKDLPGPREKVAMLGKRQIMASPLGNDFRPAFDVMQAKSHGFFASPPSNEFPFLRRVLTWYKFQRRGDHTKKGNGKFEKSNPYIAQPV